MTQPIKGGVRATGTVVTADTLVYTGPCIVYGATVNVVLSAATIDLRDAISAGTGVIKLMVPPLAAVGFVQNLGGVGIKYDTGLFVKVNGTGTVVVLWEPLNVGD